MPFAPASSTRPANAVPANSAADGTPSGDGPAGDQADDFRVAKSIYALRRRRDEAAPFKGLFGEPAWDILLDLFIAHCRGGDLQVSSVCIEASVPSTTILRWIARLESEGMLYRVADRADGRRRYVRLTEDGLAMMRSILGAIGGGR